MLECKLYEIRSNVTNEVYIGVTPGDVRSCVASHKGSYNRTMKGGKPNSKAEIVISTSDYEVNIIDTFECDNRNEMRKIKNKYVKEHECVNKVGKIDGSGYEYRKNYYNKYWNEKHKDKKEKMTCSSCGRSFQIRRKEKHEKTAHHIKSLGPQYTRNDYIIKWDYFNR